MKRLLLLMLPLLPTLVQAEESKLELFTPDHISLELHLLENVRDSYMAPRDTEMVRGVAINTNFNLVHYGKFHILSKNRIEFEQSERTGRIIHGGLRYNVAASVDIEEHQALSIGKAHYSYHIFDDSRDGGFPVWDSYYVELVIYRK